MKTVLLYLLNDSAGRMISILEY